MIVQSIICKKPVSQIEYDSLVSLDIATDGDNWCHIRKLWNTTYYPACQWQGVTCACQNDTNIVVEFSITNFCMVGTIPPTISGLSHLNSLTIQIEQSLSSIIPEELFNISTLSGLTLSNNQLSRTNPNAISQLSLLKSLDLDNNQLSGTIPNGISQ